MRRNRLFRGTTQMQLYCAIFFGMISSAYIWLPVANELELHKQRRMKEGNAESYSKITGAHENIKDK